MTTDHILKTMKSKGLNIMSLAKKMNVARGTVYNWIHDPEALKPYQKKSLAEGMDVNVEELFGTPKFEEPLEEYQTMVSNRPRLELELKILENQAVIKDMIQRNHMEVLDRLSKIEAKLNLN